MLRAVFWNSMFVSRTSMGRVAMGTLIRRFPKLELASDEPAWNGRLVLRGLDRLPVTLAE